MLCHTRAAISAWSQTRSLHSLASLPRSPQQLGTDNSSDPYSTSNDTVTTVTTSSRQLRQLLVRHNGRLLAGVYGSSGFTRITVRLLHTTEPQ